MSNQPNQSLILTQTKTQTDLYGKAYDKIINTFPIYYKIFKRYYNKGEDVSDELNRIYKPIFIGLVDFYSQFMVEGIKQIIVDIKNKFNPDLPYALIDYLEWLFGNIFYETFLFEIKKIAPENISYEHLCVFEYIVNVECIKYHQYDQIICELRKTQPESKLLLALTNRIERCLKKISFCLSWVEKTFPSSTYISQICNQIISTNGIESKIDTKSTNAFNSFMDMSWKKN